MPSLPDFGREAAGDIRRPSEELLVRIGGRQESGPLHLVTVGSDRGPVLVEDSGAGCGCGADVRHITERLEERRLGPSVDSYFGRRRFTVAVG